MRGSVRAAGAFAGRVRRAMPRGGLGRSGGLVVLAYHRIDSGGGGLAVSPGEFRAHLEWLEESGLRIVDLGAEPIPPRGMPPQVALTFDDGYRSVAEVAWPELSARNWPASLFVVAGMLDGELRFPWDRSAHDGRAALLDRRALTDLMAEGMHVGSHTMTHRYLPTLSPREVAAELRTSRQALEDLLGRSVTRFSYPMGGWTGAIRGQVRAAGYRIAVTSDRGRNLPGADSLRLRRQPTEPDPEVFALTVEGGFDFLRPVDRSRQLAQRLRRASRSSA
jgi:peptidoglycan/xylan/chitin deacetylase (PgdA/CDA1 family)